MFIDVSLKKKKDPYDLVFVSAGDRTGMTTKHNNRNTPGCTPTQRGCQKKGFFFPQACIPLGLRFFCKHASETQRDFIFNTPLANEIKTCRESARKRNTSHLACGLHILCSTLCCVQLWSAKHLLTSTSTSCKKKKKIAPLLSSNKPFFCNKSCHVGRRRVRSAGFCSKRCR